MRVPGKGGCWVIWADGVPTANSLPDAAALASHLPREEGGIRVPGGVATDVVDAIEPAANSLEQLRLYTEGNEVRRRTA